ncbi:hypothetical protein TcasGA2_TC012186 [Tribolium castaneum]|uniref:Uncharacterized protein n=1 Tax=Tribolium castaneum TaxID=7070 RepID=D6X0J8_TRICA|nr:hypothetical protein TcasGA2_TC012186 [Tribolium castaneum]
MASDIPSDDNQALMFFDDSIRDFEKIAFRFRNTGCLKIDARAFGICFKGLKQIESFSTHKEEDLPEDSILEEIKDDDGDHDEK